MMRFFENVLKILSLNLNILGNKYVPYKSSRVINLSRSDNDEIIMTAEWVMRYTNIFIW